MNIEELQLVTRTLTANTIINFCAHNKKMSNETILRFFKSQLLKAGHEIDNDDFQRYFDDLEGIEAGVHNSFNGQPKGRFIWKYYPSDLAEQILNPNKMLNIRLVPNGSSSQGNTQNNPPITPIAIRRSVSLDSPLDNRYKAAIAHPNAPNRTSPIVIDSKSPMEVEDNIVFLFTTSRGKYIPFPLNDVARLVKEAELIRSRIN